MREYTLQINQITGFILFADQKTKVLHGTPEQLREFYKKVLTHNLIFGWWEIFTFFWNLTALYRNAKARALLRKLVSEDQII